MVVLVVLLVLMRVPMLVLMRVLVLVVLMPLLLVVPVLPAWYRSRLPVSCFFSVDGR